MTRSTDWKIRLRSAGEDASEEAAEAGVFSSLDHFLAGLAGGAALFAGAADAGGRAEAAGVADTTGAAGATATAGADTDRAGAETAGEAESTDADGLEAGADGLAGVHEATKSTAKMNVFFMPSRRHESLKLASVMCLVKIGDAMDPRSGRIVMLEEKEDALEKGLIPIPPEDLEQLRASTIKQRKEWAAAKLGISPTGNRKARRAAIAEAMRAARKERNQSVK